MDNIKTIAEFSKIVGHSHQAIYKLIKKGVLPSVRIVGKRVIDLNNTAVKDYLMKKGKEI